jgi:long-chain acyl-CoA synthetase
VALISLQREELLAFARAQGLPVEEAPASLAALTRHPKVHAHVEQLIARINQELPTQAQLRKFAVLPEPFSVSAGELTECDTPRRGTIAERYRTLIDSFYAESY